MPWKKFGHWQRTLWRLKFFWIFDSCFSGTIFTNRSASSVRALTADEVEKLMRAPARVFISAGLANERVPSRSPIPDLLVAAINGGADKYGRGVVSATAIGIYLREQVRDLHINLTPQEGSLNDAAYVEGDFLFRVIGGTTAPAASLPSNAVTYPPAATKYRRTECPLCPDMIEIPGSLFRMGDSANDGAKNEQPVLIDEPSLAGDPI
jgi:hypothetical protein